VGLCIVDVCEFYAERGGGVKTYAHDKLAAGARAGHDVVILAPDDTASERDLLGGRLVTIPEPKLPVDRRYHMFVSTQRIHDALDRLQPDVIEASSPYLAAHAVASYRGGRAKTLVFHQDPIAVYPHTFLDRVIARDTIDRMFEPYWSYMRKLSQSYDATVTSGAWLAKRLHGLGIHAPVAVPFGIDKVRFDSARRDASVRDGWLERCGAPSDAALIVAVGRHHPEKRMHVVIDAVRRAAELAAPRALALVMIGDGPLRKLVELWARKLPHVCVAGFVSDRDHVAATLASADLVLHASAAETYGLSVAEAICSGTPVVVPDSGGASDLADPAYAESYATGDASAAAEAVLRLLARDREALRFACVTQGRAKIARASQHFEGLFALYAELCRSKDR
jgi:alpha-1,6-mannosyltransferase